jgi:hypothetical protein
VVHLVFGLNNLAVRILPEVSSPQDLGCHMLGAGFFCFSCHAMLLENLFQLPVWSHIPA